MSVSVALKGVSQTIGEGPYWESSTQTLLYVDLMNSCIHRYSPETGQDEVRSLGTGTVSVVIPCTKGGYLVSHERTLKNLDWETGQIAQEYITVGDGVKHALNDGKCDASGRIWIGSSGLETSPLVFQLAQGSLYSVETDGLTTKKHLSGIDVSNGIAWTADNATMFFADTMKRTIFAFNYNVETGDIENQRTAIEFTNSVDEDGLGPDGMCMDTNDKLWVACPFAGTVAKYDPETGQKIQKVEFPVKGITSCCFGGKNNDELFVTCLGPERTAPDQIPLQPLCGSLFKVTGLGVTGGHVFPFNYRKPDEL